MCISNRIESCSNFLSRHSTILREFPVIKMNAQLFFGQGLAELFQFSTVKSFRLSLRTNLLHHETIEMLLVSFRSHLSTSCMLISAPLRLFSFCFLLTFDPFLFSSFLSFLLAKRLKSQSKCSPCASLDDGYDDDDYPTLKKREFRLIQCQQVERKVAKNIRRLTFIIAIDGFVGFHSSVGSRDVE